VKVGTFVDTGKGRPYRLSSVPYRWVLHTIECPPGTDVEPVARAHQYPPHFWVNMPDRQIVQTIDTTLAAQALAHPAGSVETNHARALQVEIAAYASEVTTYPLKWWAWLGDALIAPVARHHGVNLGERARFVPYPQSYGVHATQRFSSAHWLIFNGVCGHQHVPANDHGDPGLVPIDLICNSTAPAPPDTTDPVPDRPESEHMILVKRGARRCLLYPSGLLIFVIGDQPGEIPRWEPSDETWKDLVIVNEKVRKQLGLDVDKIPRK
jgi:hypothetical protein